jgi:hypothetical protein
VVGPLRALQSHRIDGVSVEQAAEGCARAREPPRAGELADTLRRYAEDASGLGGAVDTGLRRNHRIFASIRTD